MVQIIEPNESIFGRLGKGFGKGLAEQLPKEVDRYRLSQGLSNFEKESENLTPLQSLARLSSIPGVTPQMIQSFGELAKQQNTRNAFKQAAGKARGPTPQEDEQLIQQPGQQRQPQQTEQPGVGVPRGAPNQARPQVQPGVNVKPEEFGQPQITQKNPLRPEAIPALPWTPERRIQEVAELADLFPNLNPQELQAMAADNESRELAQPGAQQARDTYLKQQQAEANNKLTTQLETKLQKQGKDVFQDITGEMLVNIQRGMEKDLRTNPKATVDDVVNKWSNRALELAKAKTQVEALSKRDLYDQVVRPEKTLNSLKAAQKIYAEAGNKEEFFNTLKSDFNMSPSGAALVAYPLEKRAQEYINTNVRKTRVGDSEKNSIKYANDLDKYLSSEDSLIAIARSLRQKDPFFDETTFFNQLRDDENIRLSPRQRREIINGVPDIFPNWGDISILPYRGFKP